MSIELVAAAVGFLVPYLTEAGKEAAKTIGKESAGAGIKVLGWLRDKVTGRAKEALEDLEQQPDSADNQADLRKQLVKLLRNSRILRNNCERSYPKRRLKNPQLIKLSARELRPSKMSGTKTRHRSRCRNRDCALTAADKETPHRDCRVAALLAMTSSERRAARRERILPFSKACSLACRTIAAIGFRVERSVLRSPRSTVAQTCW
jgi:hypothetical protein